MEAAKFVKLLKKHKWTLVAIPILVMATAFMLLRKQPDRYMSKATLSAGIVENTQSMILGKDLLQEAKVSQQFSNLLQMMQMKQVFDQVSYKLILHDLTQPTPLKAKSKLISQLPKSAIDHAIEVYTERYNTKQPLSLWDQDQKGLYDVLTSMGYDYGSLYQKTRIYRIETSDFIVADFESDSPKLSAFVVNTLCEEFIKHYTSITKESEYKAIQFLDTLRNQKLDTFNAMMERLLAYKKERGVLNLGEQAGSVLSQMSDIEGRIQQARKDAEAATAALTSIDARFEGEARGYVDNKLAAINREISADRNRVLDLTEEYLRSNYDPKVKARLDSARAAWESRTKQVIDRASVNPQMVKDNLFQQKIGLEVNRDLARGSVASMQKEYDRLNEKFKRMVPDDAIIKQYESNIETVRREYLDLQNRYAQTSLTYNSSMQLRQIEKAMPEQALPSKKMMMVALSGVSSLLFCLLVLFVLFYIDNAVRTPSDLAKQTGMVVLGTLPTVANKGTFPDINALWQQSASETKVFRTMLRSLRFEVEEAVGQARMVAVTSFEEAEGKTLFALSLANAFVLVNKKVLLIDGNFNNPLATKLAKTEDFLEDYLKDSTHIIAPAYANDVTYLGNHGKEQSLFEIIGEETVRSRLNELRYIYDVIIIDCPPLDTLSQCKEWVAVADKAIAVFECHNTIQLQHKPYLEFLKSRREKFVGWALNRYDESAQQKDRRGKRKA
jgi:polysaccharide biosynthesis transport protein